MTEQLAIPDPEWLTAAEVARHYRVSARTVLRWAAAGEFGEVRRHGRTVRIHRSELDRPAGAAA